MKQIPFKCRFGHVIIKEFQDSENKPSSITCNRCIEEQQTMRKLFITRDGHKTAMYEVPILTTKVSVRQEMAVRY